MDTKPQKYWLQRKNNEESKNDEIHKIRLAYSQDILNKRYDFYTWMDGKARLSLTINSVLLGFSYWLVTNHGGDVVSKYLIVAGIIVLSMSILILLTVALPAMKSPVWKQIPDQLIIKQPRTVIGVNEFKDPAEYVKTVRSLAVDDMIGYNADQIWKMNKIVLVNSSRMSFATRFTSLAVIFLVSALLYSGAISVGYFNA